LLAGGRFLSKQRYKTLKVLLLDNAAGNDVFTAIETIFRPLLPTGQ
jgi:hypothetical protein